MKLLVLLALVGCVFAYGEMWCQMSTYSANIVISGYMCRPINAPLKYQSVAAREYPQTKNEDWQPYPPQALNYHLAYCVSGDLSVLRLCKLTRSDRYTNEMVQPPWIVSCIADYVESQLKSPSQSSSPSNAHPVTQIQSHSPSNAPPVTQSSSKSHLASKVLSSSPTSTPYSPITPEPRTRIYIGGLCAILLAIMSLFLLILLLNIV